MSRSTPDTAYAHSPFAYGALTLFGQLSQNCSAGPVSHSWQSLPRHASHPGLGSSLFARRYYGNRCFFLFLRLLRCFSSPGSPPYTMDSCMDTRLFSVWVPPFRYPRIFGYLLLPAAFRSLSRLSSALSAKASALRPFLLNLFFSRTLPCIALHLVRSLLLSFHCLYLLLCLPAQPSDVSFFSDCLILSIFGFQGTAVNLFQGSMETKRFELSTPCLQGRCSPN